MRSSRKRGVSMARALVIKGNFILEDKTAEDVRQEVLRQYNAGGVIAIPKFYEVIEVEFDSVRAEELGECQPDVEKVKTVRCHNCGVEIIGKFKKCPLCHHTYKREV